MTIIRQTLPLLFTVCACLLASAQATFCQRLSILVGTVTDSVTSKPVADASIIVAGTALGASADSAGHYIVRRVPRGPQTVIIKHVAYNQTTRDVVIPADVDTVVLDVYLLPAVLPLPGVTTVGEMRLHQIFRDSVYRRWARVIISAKQIEEEGLIDFDQFVHWHVPWAENEYELFVDGARTPLDLRDVIKMHQVEEIFVWRKIDAPIELVVGLTEKERPNVSARSRSAEGLPSAPRGVILDPFLVKPYIILVRTK